jgi:ParB family chromosome partitioning protein
MLRLLKLPEEVIELIREDKLSFGHAKILVGLERDDAIEISKKIIKDNLSVREAERLVRELKNKEEKKELQKVAHKLQNYGFKVEYNKNFIKIIFKNEDDIKKLEELLKIDNT